MENIVSAKWLSENLELPNLVVLNATIPKVVGNQDSEEKMQIIGSRFFDIKKKFSNTKGQFPNTFPSLEQFNKEAQLLGVNNDSYIVIYDELSIYSSARAWWLFKAFGHNNVAVLDGGFPKWKKLGYKTEVKTLSIDALSGNFSGKLSTNSMCFFNDIIKVSEQPDSLIIDARSEKRFSGEVPEPRAGLRNGTIPNSINLPYTTVLENGTLKNKEQLIELFQTIGANKKSLYFSCGSGITACVLALAATVANIGNLTVYDGSWTEYGSLIS